MRSSPRTRRHRAARHRLLQRHGRQRQVLRTAFYGIAGHRSDRARVDLQHADRTATSSTTRVDDQDRSAAVRPQPDTALIDAAARRAARHDRRSAIAKRRRHRHEGRLRRRARQRRHDGAVRDSREFQSMLIRKKAAARPRAQRADPARGPSRAPVTRRDFISAGLMTGPAVVAAGGPARHARAIRARRAGGAVRRTCRRHEANRQASATSRRARARSRSSASISRAARTSTARRS